MEIGGIRDEKSSFRPSLPRSFGALGQRIVVHSVVGGFCGRLTKRYFWYKIEHHMAIIL